MFSRRRKFRESSTRYNSRSCEFYVRAGEHSLTWSVSSFSGILTPRLVLNLRSAVRPKDDDFWTRAARPQVTDDKFTSLTAMEVELDETTTYQDGDSYSQCRGDGEVEYLSG